MTETKKPAGTTPAGSLNDVTNALRNNSYGADDTSGETQCPGFVSGQCATCDCPWITDRPPMVAAPGAMFQQGPDRAIFPWQEPHPDDVAELKRRDNQRAARRMMERATGHQPGKGYVLAALYGEAQNIIDGRRRNDQINRST